MPARRGAARALQDELPAHELAIIFADRALGGREAGVGSKGALRPFPDVAEHAAAGRGATAPASSSWLPMIGIGRSGEILPFGFGRQARAGPAGVGIGLDNS